MRLSKQEIEIIKSTLLDIFGECEIYIFGSRLNDNIKGGDIDIFIVVNENVKNQRVKKTKAIYSLEEKLLKPIDIVIHRDFNRLIEQEALKGVKI